MRRRSRSRRKWEGGGRHQRFRTHHKDEPGSHSSVCRSDKKGCSNNFSASRPFELRVGFRWINQRDAPQGREHLGTETYDALSITQVSALPISLRE